MMFRSLVPLIVAAAAFTALIAPAHAQNYGGIDGFARDYPIPTYEYDEEQKVMRPTAKRLRKKDIGPIDDVAILAVFWTGGIGYLQLETTSGDHWVNRQHVKPRKTALVDKAIDDSNGNIGCPPGQTLVAQARSRNERSGVARNLGGVSAYCK